MSDPSVVTLSRPKPPKAVISLVPMIDVMLILLVFFMVTSTYLNLDMIPAVDAGDDSLSQPQSAETAPGSAVMIRIGADGLPTIRGRAFGLSDLSRMIASRLDADPNLRILILPSGAADMQALVSVMDSATQAGARNVRVVRLEALE
ncbi:biopolymer transporter ExbD [Marivita sp. S6314]|uniref:ExbD/TolR family protein n=1 Tax=Marivita sp. S6314 TaxID=2926406 RepID=UPI001FF45888|nr:biopolymer transporter ExbD [Marivita sp. S6314]MCK0149302.1 biopolymer transporter ExbD [Marivita sp. S6314]